MQRIGVERTYLSVERVGLDEVAAWVAARDGDGRAFSSLFVAHRDRVFRQARRIVDSDADADDVTAAAFFELWRRREVVPLIQDSVLPWILTTTAHLARNVRRGTRRYRAALDRLPRQPAAEDPAQQALARVQAARGETALSWSLRRLRPIDLALVTLTAYEGYPIADAAAAVGITESAARTRLSRSRARLRSALTADGAVAGMEG